MQEASPTASGPSTSKESEVGEYEVVLQQQFKDEEANQHGQEYGLLLSEHQPSDLRGDSISAGIGNTVTSFNDPVSSRNMSSHLIADHESFRKRLIDDVLGNDAGDKVPMEKVVMLIWQFRDDPAVVRFMTRFVAKVRKDGCLVFAFLASSVLLMELLLLLLDEWMIGKFSLKQPGPCCYC